MNIPHPRRPAPPASLAPPPGAPTGTSAKPVGDDTEVPADDLAERMLRASRYVRGAIAASLAEEFDGAMSPHQARTLRTIARMSPVRPSALAEHLRVAVRSATEVVEHLQHHGWIDRSPDPSDGRATLITVTPAGEVALTSITAARARAADAALGHLSAAQRSQIAAALAPLTEDGGPASR